MVVVDTNVLAYLLIEGDRTKAAQDLYANDPDWQSEAFVLVELTNILTTYTRAGALTREPSHLGLRRYLTRSPKESYVASMSVSSAPSIHAE